MEKTRRSPEASAKHLQEGHDRPETQAHPPHPHPEARDHDAAKLALRLLHPVVRLRHVGLKLLPFGLVLRRASAVICCTHSGLSC